MVEEADDGGLVSKLGFFGTLVSCFWWHNKTMLTLPIVIYTDVILNIKMQWMWAFWCGGTPATVPLEASY